MPSASTTTMANLSTEDKRRLECLRKRKYRAAKRSELASLEDELQFYKEKLYQVQATMQNRTQNSPPSPTTIANQMFHRYNKYLREQVENQNKVMRLLSAWVASQTPQRGLHLPNPCIHSTLLADPISRLHGYQWLSERVYQSALLAYPTHPFSSRIDDATNVVVHLGEDKDGPSMSAVESHYQCTVFANFKQVAQMYWETNLKSAATVLTEVVDTINDHLVYHRRIDHILRTTTLAIVCLFVEENRAVITHCYVADDERTGFASGEMRPHGFAWTVFEGIMDSVTLVRHSTLQYAPLTCDGVVSLEQIGQIFRRPVAGQITHREAYLEQVRTTAVKTFSAGYEASIRNFSKLFDG